MKVFISWSETRSEYVAKALSEWLKDVIQTIDPWISKHIDSGVTWARELAEQLEQTSFGVACVTPENQFAPWILFEAGAITKKSSKSFFCPYLIDMKETDLQLPLSSFQGNLANRDGTWALVQSINKAQADHILDDKTLERGFTRCWPEFEKTLQKLPAAKTKVPPERAVRALQEETLEIVRRMDLLVSQLGANVKVALDAMASYTYPGAGPFGTSVLASGFGSGKTANLVSPQWEKLDETAKAFEELMALAQELKKKKRTNKK
jgi:hypothetical protein